MAIYIEIDKKDEKEGFVTYECSDSCGYIGALTIKKETGELKIIDDCREDKDNYLMHLACRKIAAHWVKGELPNETCFAA